MCMVFLSRPRHALLGKNHQKQIPKCIGLILGIRKKIEYE